MTRYARSFTPHAGSRSPSRSPPGQLLVFRLEEFSVRGPTPRVIKKSRRLCVWCEVQFIITKHATPSLRQARCATPGPRQRGAVCAGPSKEPRVEGRGCAAAAKAVPSPRSPKGK
jgi:hypothetical protein